MWGVLIVLAFVAATGGLLYMARQRVPDDRLALELAAALGAPAPALIDRLWQLSFSHDGRQFELRVTEKGGILRRPLSFRLSHSATVHDAAKRGRDQEDYGDRPLIPVDPNNLASGLEAVDGQPLRGWEEALPPDLPARMKTLDLRWIGFSRTDITTGRTNLDEHFDESLVREMADLLNSLSIAISQSTLH